MATEFVETPDALEALSTRHAVLPEAFDAQLLACLERLEGWLVTLHYKHVHPPELLALRRVFARLPARRQEALLAKLPWRANALAMLPACASGAPLAKAVREFEHACQLHAPSSTYVLGTEMAEGFLEEVGPRLVPFVAERLRTERTPRVVAALLRVLVGIGDASAARTLAAQHTAPRAELRIAAVGLSLLGAATELAPVVHDELDGLLGSRKVATRRFAVSVLEGLPTTAATTAQIEAALQRERSSELRGRLFAARLPAEAGTETVSLDTPEASQLFRDLSARRVSPGEHVGLGANLLPLGAVWAERMFLREHAHFRQKSFAPWHELLRACEEHPAFAQLALRPFRVLAGATDSGTLWAGFHVLGALREAYGARLGSALVALERAQTPSYCVFHLLREHAPERFVTAFAEGLQRARGTPFDLARNVAWTPGPPADLRIASFLRAAPRSVRQVAAVYFARSPNPAALDALEGVLSGEEDPGIAASLQDAIRCTRAATTR